VTDENAPQRVLLEAAARQQKPKEEAPTTTDPEKRQEELKKFGIHFDDDYDYMQHLKKRENDVVWEFMENPNQARKHNYYGNMTLAQNLSYLARKRKNYLDLSLKVF